MPEKTRAERSKEATMAKQAAERGEREVALEVIDDALKVVNGEPLAKLRDKLQAFVDEMPPHAAVIEMAGIVHAIDAAKQRLVEHRGNLFVQLNPPQMPQAPQPPA